MAPGSKLSAEGGEGGVCASRKLRGKRLKRKYLCAALAVRKIGADNAVPPKGGT
jgi:hypothetical protein